MLAPAELRYSGWPGRRKTQTRGAQCVHICPVPPADHRDRDAARTVAFHPEQGWSLLCNGVIVFDDMGIFERGAHARGSATDGMDSLRGRTGGAGRALGSQARFMFAPKAGISPLDAGETQDLGFVKRCSTIPNTFRTGSPSRRRR